MDETATGASLDDAIGAAFGPDEGPAPDVAAAPEPAAPAPSPPDDEWEAVPSHEELSNGVKRVNRIPHDRVSKIIEKQRAKAVDEALGALRESLGLPADAPLTVDDAKKVLGERGTKLTEAERELQSMQWAADLMERDPEQFLATLARRNPAYQRYLSPPAPPAAPAPAPEPLNLDDYSVDLGQGRRTFSFEGLQKFVADQVQRATTELAKRYEPLETRAKAEAEMQARRERLAPVMQFAQSLPGFKEHEAKILKLLQEDKTITLPQAYERVVWQAHVANETAMRERLLKELQTAPTSTTTTAAPVPAKAQTVDDIVAAEIDRAMTGVA